MDKRQLVMIERALEQLSNPVLRKSKAAPQLEKLLVGARKSGVLPIDDLRRATTDLVREIDVPRYFAHDADESDDAGNGGLAILFLLLLLALLAALAGEDSDLAALIDELIQSLLDLLKGA